MMPKSTANNDIKEKLVPILADIKEIPNGVNPFMTPALDIKKPNMPTRM